MRVGRAIDSMVVQTPSLSGLGFQQDLDFAPRGLLEPTHDHFIYLFRSRRVCYYV